MAEKRRFCSFIYSNPSAQKRINFFDKLSEYKQVASGGKVRNNIGSLVSDKMSFLRNYKFSIAFENSQHPGYTTEKLLHTLVSNTIPIYWGNPMVASDFNTSAFINCYDYESFDDVIVVIKEIDQNDDLYRQYLSQPFFPDNIENEPLREKNIIDKFERIFTAQKAFIPLHRKLKQFYFDCCVRKEMNKGKRLLVKIQRRLLDLGTRTK